MSKEPLDQQSYQERIDRLSSILSDISVHAQEQATYRCPYKNRFNECTALFGCRNQRKPNKEGGALFCGGDDQLDYRSAWDTEPNTKPRARTAQPGAGTARSNGGEVPLYKGNTLFDLADQLKVQVPTSCFRTGHCHECIVEVKKGEDALNQPTEDEAFLRDNYRLACQAKVQNPDQDIEFAPLRRTPQILTQTREKPTAFDPHVTRRGDEVFIGEECADQFRGHLYGLAIDLGTTTVVMELVDLENGETLHVASLENPQRFGGSDVMNRISYDALHPGELRKALVNALNHEIQALCQRFDFIRQEIYEIVVAGNSTMRDLFFRLDVQGIGQKPYKSLIEDEYLAGLRPTTALVEKTRRLGLRANPKARVYSLPLIASHVGADTTAALLAIDMASQNETVMLVDVGTNTEVVIGHAGRMVACSCPAGPAFEGGTVSHGMPGYDGAIESIRWNGTEFDYSTIGGHPAEGLCGSGLIDLLAELRRHELMTPKGVFADKKRQLEIAPERGITLSRLDASNLAQAKAANFCGQFIALRHFGIDPQQITKLYLAGGFAHYVNIRQAIEIGFLAPVPEERIVKIGNAAIQGAREALLSCTQRARMETLIKDIEHLELETTPDFFEVFVEGCQFKPMPASVSQPL
jgi:uncharacterized 2Fe-2S/4Fe-4S cluster protein (DUF4445 family)